nr:hypothetical protein [Tanacetum cinerariifolium]
MNYVPVIAGTNSNNFLRKGASFNAGQSSMETGPSQDYILMPLWNEGSLFDSASKDSDGDNKDNDGPSKVSEYDNQEGPNAENSTKDVNTVRPKVDISNISATYPVLTTPNTRIYKHHSLDNVIGDIQSGVETRRITVTTDEQGFISAIYEEKTHKDLHTCLFAYFLSQEELKKITNALKDLASVEAMQEELLQGVVIKNKARLVAQGCTQEEGIDYDELFSPEARIEAIRLFLAYASFMGFLVYQMDVKSAFMYERIEEEVYMCQPPGFKDPDYPDKVYKVEKALYGLHQAPRAWYETLAKYLLDNGFRRGKIDQTLFIKRQKEDILLVQVYVDDIIFGSTKKELYTEFEKLDGIFISPDKYGDKILRKFRSMIGSLMYLTSSRLDIMFVCKKQIVVATSTTEAEYVSAASCCGQLWHTASVRTLDNGEIELNAIVDGHDKSITEASIRRHLKLAYADSISTLPITEIVEQLALMGYVTDYDKLTF